MMFLAQCVHDITVSYGLNISLFLAGLVGGFTHCAGMCGPFVLAQTGQGPAIQKRGESLLLPYHLGRMTTYVALAVLVNSVLNLAFLFSGLRALIAAPILLLAGVIFLVSAFPRLSLLFPWISHIRMSFPYKIVSRFSGALMKKQTLLGRYALGVLLGFLPCALLLSALLAASTAPSPLHAATAMALFTLGTMPSLILVSIGSRALGQKYPQALKRISRGAMVVSGVWLIVLAGFVIS